MLGVTVYWWALWLAFGGSLNYLSNGTFGPLANVARLVGSDIVMVGLATLIVLQFLLRNLRARDYAVVSRASSR